MPADDTTTETVSKARAERLARQEARRGKGVHPALVAVGLGLAAFMGFAVNDIVSRPLSPVAAVVLVDAFATPAAIVEAFADGEVRFVPLVDLPIPDGRVVEVWTQPGPPDVEGESVSLGTFRTVAEVRLAGADLPRPVEDQLYQITLEPVGGAPGGRPDGPVLALGHAQLVR